tara:strand:+ start:220 stop:417 length:198 start_codon:yes stop_codon:yes gene_type:complete
MEPSQASGLESLLPLILVGLAWYFIWFRPRKKKQEQYEDDLRIKDEKLDERLSSIEQRLTNLENV